MGRPKFKNSKSRLLILFPVILQIIPISQTQKCDCMITSIEEMDRPTDKFSRGSSNTGNYQICYSEDKPYGQVYDTDNNTCYNLLEQGPCPDGMLLVRDTTSLNFITCLPTCDTENLPKKEWTQKYRSRECTLPISKDLPLKK